MSIIILAALFLFLIGIIGYGIGIYNGLILLRRNIERNWSNIDVLLKQRYDEIGKLVKVCEGYMQYERETLEKLVTLRSSYFSSDSIKEKNKIEGEIAGTLKTLFAVAENYPELKTNMNFLHLQKRISEIENAIADRREFYNDSVTIFNTRIQQIPDILIARMCRYVEQPLFQVEPKECRDVPVRFDFPGESG
jgi:LemA protein